MRAFELVTARDCRHAAALLAEHALSARILAGGTDLLVELKSAADVPRVIVDVSRAEDLKVIALKRGELPTRFCRGAHPARLGRDLRAGQGAAPQGGMTWRT